MSDSEDEENGLVSRGTKYDDDDSDDNFDDEEDGLATRRGGNTTPAMDDIAKSQLESARQFLYDEDEGGTGMNMAVGAPPALRTTSPAVTTNNRTMYDAEDNYGQQDVEIDDRYQPTRVTPDGGRVARKRTTMMPKLFLPFGGAGGSGSGKRSNVRETENVDEDEFQEKIRNMTNLSGASTHQRKNAKRRGVLVAQGHDMVHRAGGWKWCLLILAMVFGALAVISWTIVVQPKLDRSDDGDNRVDDGDNRVDSGPTEEKPTPDMTPEELTQRHNGLKNDLLSTVYVTGQESPFEQASSPQSRALTWIAKHDGLLLESSDPTFLLRYGLAVMWFAFGGLFDAGSPKSLWKSKENWLTSTDHCTWHGVECAGGTIIGLNLTSNGINGRLPHEISLLSSLDVLDLSSNRIIGKIPPSIGKLDKLRILYLSKNSLGGSIPTTVGTMTTLRDIDLTKNELSGTLPQQITKATDLQILLMESNVIAGTLPDMSSLTKLETLILSRNKFHGSIPDSLFSNLQSLKIFEVAKNEFTGPLPETISSLTKLEKLHIFQNKFDGQLPDGLGDLTTLTHLELPYNSFTGTIPKTIQKLTKLERLFLNNLKLSGTVDSTIGSLSNLIDMYLHNNQLTGTIPDVFQSFTNMDAFKVHDNTFDGTIPTSLQSCTKLTEITLHSNDMTGTIPESFGVKLVQLKRFTVEHNEMDGSMPDELCTLKDQRKTDEDVNVFLSADCKNENDEHYVACACCNECF